MKAKDFILSTQKIEQRVNIVVFRGFPCVLMNDLFKTPTISRHFGCFFVKIDKTHMMQFTNNEISNKRLSVPQQNNIFALVELLHGNQNIY